MTPGLKISKYVIDRLEKIQNQCSGRLYGVMYDSTLLVVGFILETQCEKNEKSIYKLLQNNFPTEVYLCGLVKFGDCTDTQAHLKEIIQDVDITDNPLLLHYYLGSVKTSFFIHGQLQEISYDILSEDQIWKDFVHVRLQTNLNLICEANPTSIEKAMTNIRKKMASGQVSFHFPKTTAYLMGSGSDTGLSGLTGEPKVGELWQLCDSAGGEGANIHLKKKKNKQIEIDVMPVGLVLKTTRDTGSENLNKTAVKMITRKGNNDEAYIQVPLEVDALSMVYRDTKVIQLYDMLVESVCNSLRLMEQCILQQLKSSKENIISRPRTYHFLPNNCGHFLTFIYPNGMNEADTVVQRKRLHEQLNLPLDRPFFRRANAHIFKNQLVNAPLVNTHEGLNSQVKEGEVYAVYGKYSYHHYMQDRFDDDGWGCAYRSLQTIVSWFRWQGYTEASVPTHKEIQKCLYDIGDKPDTFVGSKQWIGSAEVSFCLEALLGVTSRIMFVSSGEDMACKGAELAMHFQTNGTPVMIGGGVLAHTILGVDYNNSTGELKFLILDPHYTGAEDIGIIQSKGWCSWKGVDFWVKTAYYNLCLPQRPRCI